MKLLMISGDRKILAGEGGPFATTLAGLAGQCERIDVVCPRGRGVPAFPREGTAYRVADRVWFHPSPWPFALQPLWIRRRGAALLKEHRHDVVTVQEYVPRVLGRPALALARAFGVPSCGEIHGDPLERLARWPGLRGAWGARFGKAVAGHAAVRAVSEGLKREMVAFGVPEGRVRVVPALYIDGETFRPRPDVEKRYGACFCGRLVPGKGLEVTLDAVARVQSATLLVIGDGPSRAAAEVRCKRLGIADRVTFAGWRSSREELATLLASAETFVMASRAEGGPRVAFEAMATGLPVIATRVGLLGETMADRAEGVFFDGTPDALAAALRELLADADLRRKLGEKGRILAARFERAKTLDDYADFLASL